MRQGSFRRWTASHAIIFSFFSTTYSHQHEPTNHNQTRQGHTSHSALHQQQNQLVAPVNYVGASTTCNINFQNPILVNIGLRHSVGNLKIFTFQCRHFRISRNNEFPAILSGVTYKSLHDGSSFLETRKQNMDEKIYWKNNVES